MTRVALLALAATGCTVLLDTERFATAGAGDDEPTGDGGPTVAHHCDAMDVVFVIDDSASMMEEQSNLAMNLPWFAMLLATYTTPDGHGIDYRIAITTTSRDLTYTIVPAPGFPGFEMVEHGDNGAFRATCDAPQRWLDRDAPALEQALACRANVGIIGSSIEMPLMTSRWALSKRIADGTNAEFLRPDALLAIVTITDEDDASTARDHFILDATQVVPVDYHPEDHVAFLDALAGDRSRWAAAVIAGDGDCMSEFGTAKNAVRLKRFAELAAPQVVFSSICEGSLAIGLEQALYRFQTACGEMVAR